MTQDNLKSFARDLGIATKAGIDLMLAPLLDRIAALERARLADAGRIKSLESQLESLESRGSNHATPGMWPLVATCRNDARRTAHRGARDGCRKFSTKIFCDFNPSCSKPIRTSTLTGTSPRRRFT